MLEKSSLEYEVCFVRTRKTSDERRSNLVVVRNEDAQSDAVIAKNERKEVP